MKNSKFLFLLVLLLCFTVFLAACGGTGNESESESDSSSDASVNEEVPAKDPLEHEMLDYFILEEEEESYEFEPIAKYKGEIVDYDSAHNILALKTQDLDVYNCVTDTVTLYNALTGDKITEFSASYPVYVNDEKVELSVDIEYPVVRAVKKSYSEDSEKTVYEATYHLLNEKVELLHTTTYYNSDASLRENWVHGYGNGLVSVTMGEKVLWLDRNMEAVRTVDAVAENGYMVDRYDSEYQGYLYAWDNSELQIFNRYGVCSGLYMMEHRGILNVHVLDNGNVLIQDLEEVGIDESYDVLIGTVRYQMTSLIMNMVDGSTTEVALDYLVETLQTAYAQDCAATTLQESDLHMPFKLAKGHENQAIIYRVNEAGTVSLYQEYVVMTNDLEIEYTVKNTVKGADLKNANPVNAYLYEVSVFEAGSVVPYIFDLDGNALSPTNSLHQLRETKSYIVTATGIYDKEMNLVYDMAANGFSTSWQHRSTMSPDAANDIVYMSRHNFETGIDELYVYDAESGAPVLLHANRDETVVGTFGGGYCMMNAETQTMNFYNVSGELKISAKPAPRNFVQMKDVFCVCALLEGEPVIFVVR